MSFVNDLFIDLPDELKRLIVTQYLTGRSLCNSLRVSKSWYNYFKNFVWDDETIGKSIRSSLENNWRSGVFREIEEYWQIDEECEIGAVSQNLLALVSPDNSPLETVRIIVFNISSGEVWSIPEIFDSVFLTAMKNKYEIVMTDKFVAIRLDLREVRGEPRSQQVLVWSLETKKKIADRKIESLKTMHVSCNEDDEDVLILHADYIEIWDFSVNNQISKVQTTNLSPTPFTSGYFMSPYILQTSVNNATGIRKVQVWKYSRSPVSLQTIFEIDNLATFVHENGNPQSFHIGEIVYFGGYFIISCVCTLRAGTDDIQSLSFKVLSDEGNILRECFLPQCRLDADVLFFPFNGRLVTTVAESVFLFHDGLEDIATNSDDEQIVLNRIGALDGTKELIFKNTMCNSAEIFSFNDGVVLLDIVSLNFWDDIIFRFKP